MYLVYTRYIPDIYFGVYVGIYQVYTRYIPGLEITRYIPGIYLVYTSYIADIGLYQVSYTWPGIYLVNSISSGTCRNGIYPVYTWYIPGIDQHRRYRRYIPGIYQVYTW